jgi:antitoxin (DNA-binding transcriptional repressor) of toxin-antitoxin stability system
VQDIQASDAKAHLPQILDAVERGETVRITRRPPHCASRARGRSPSGGNRRRHRRQAEIDSAIACIEALRSRTGKVTPDELLSARHEGHKY